MTERGYVTCPRCGDRGDAEHRAACTSDMVAGIRYAFALVRELVGRNGTVGSSELARVEREAEHRLACLLRGAESADALRELRRREALIRGEIAREPERWSITPEVARWVSELVRLLEAEDFEAVRALADSMRRGVAQ